MENDTLFPQIAEREELVPIVKAWPTNSFWKPFSMACFITGFQYV